jgi:hypothetical protein
MPYKANEARRHRIPRARYRVTNWPEYDRALQRRGSLTVWVTPEALTAWHPPGTGRRGRSRTSSDLAIETGHLLRLAFGRPWRQTEGLLRSLAALLGLSIGVPDHTTFSRRSPGLALASSLAEAQRSGPVHVVIDATGLKVHGAGEWLTEKHGERGRRTWRKLVWGSPCQAFIAVLHSDASFGPAWPDDGGECGGRRGARQWRRGSSRRELVCGGSHDPNHDAAMRIGGEAPGRRAHSAPRLGGHASARVAATSDRHRPLATRPWTSAESPCS